MLLLHATHQHEPHALRLLCLAKHEPALVDGDVHHREVRDLGRAPVHLVGDEVFGLVRLCPWLGLSLSLRAHGTGRALLHLVDDGGHLRRDALVVEVLLPSLGGPVELPEGIPIGHLVLEVLNEVDVVLVALVVGDLVVLVELADAVGVLLRAFLLAAILSFALVARAFRLGLEELHHVERALPVAIRTQLDGLDVVPLLTLLILVLRIGLVGVIAALQTNLDLCGAILACEVDVPRLLDLMEHTEGIGDHRGRRVLLRLLSLGGLLLREGVANEVGRLVGLRLVALAGRHVKGGDGTVGLLFLDILLAGAFLTRRGRLGGVGVVRRPHDLAVLAQLADAIRDVLVGVLPRLVWHDLLYGNGLELGLPAVLLVELYGLHGFPGHRLAGVVAFGALPL